MRPRIARLVVLSAIPAFAAPGLAGSPFGGPARMHPPEVLRRVQAAPPLMEAAPPLVEAAPPSVEADPALHPAPPEPGLPHVAVAPSANPLSRMALQDLGAFRQRPLFAPLRRRPDPPAAVAPPLPAEAPPESPPPDLRLVGIVAGVDRAVALVSRHEGGSTSLRVGDPVESWRVDQIAPDRIVLREGARAHTYRLFAPPPAAGGRPPVEATGRAP
ncbi:hypothetical protein [Methylobacterium sp. Leaf118]|uniref:hypothetical protein n=1 Tax=Methylobacterium sp. Leaf118 TaxID=2876562 RepID=UPI001E626F39|nr:hypothetical protein [Methylobacterium sp. Leaf118]